MKTKLRNFLKVRATATQNGKSLQLTETNFDFATPGTMMWNAFDVNHGPITVVVHEFILDSQLLCV